MSVVTLCSADCIHNSGYGYYCLCNHPDKQDQVPYGGIDRYYVDGCPLREVKPDVNTNWNSGSDLR